MKPNKNQRRLIWTPYRPSYDIRSFGTGRNFYEGNHNCHRETHMDVFKNTGRIPLKIKHDLRYISLQ